LQQEVTAHLLLCSTPLHGAGEKERGTLARLTSFFEEHFRIAEEVFLEGTVRVCGAPRRTVPKSAPKKTLFHHNQPETTKKELLFTSIVKFLDGTFSCA
jgi:hypothetical protein